MIAVLRLLEIAFIAAVIHVGNAQAQSSTSSRTAFSQRYTTHHELALPDRKIKFTATAENFVFTEPDGSPRNEITYVSYTKDSSDPATRPVSFIMNGGPGASSAYLNLLAIGPWRTLLGGARTSTSLSTLQPNADTWLDFTDLVFIDPPGTGYSRVTGGERAREYFHSVGGDIDAISDFIQRWLRERDRQHSPAYFVGASYGGFRGALLAQKLQEKSPKGFKGLLLVSPVLDFNLSHFGCPIQYPWVSASVLPSLAAIWAEKNSSLTPELLQEAEAYASSEYISDLLRGTEDTEAIERIALRLEQPTGLPPSLTKIYKGRVGRIDAQTFVRDSKSKSTPGTGDYKVYNSRWAVEYSEDYDLEALTRIITNEMDAYFKGILKFQTSEKYKVIEDSVNRNWRWGNGRYAAEALSRLEQALNADSGLRVLVAHGTADLTTPYFATKMSVAQMEIREPQRLSFKLYGGGHIFYTRDASRKAFRADAQAFFENEQNAQAPAYR